MQPVATKGGKLGTLLNQIQSPFLERPTVIPSQPPKKGGVFQDTNKSVYYNKKCTVPPEKRFGQAPHIHITH